MAVKRLVTPERFIGISTDTKPTDGATSVRPGATFLEYDTGLLYITYDGTNWVVKPELTAGTLKSVSVTKNIVTGGAYSADDVISEQTTNGLGTPWTFSAIGRANGAYGYIVKAHVVSETTAITPRLVLYLFNATPTCELDDNAANTALLHADLANYIGRIDFPSMSEYGTSDAEAIATPSTYGNLPLAFQCAAGADDLYGVLVTIDGVTLDAADDVTVTLTCEQY